MSETKICIHCGNPIHSGLVDFPEGAAHMTCQHTKDSMAGAQAVRDSEYWTAYRRNTAAMICAGMASDSAWWNYSDEEVAEWAVRRTDALIAELQKPKGEA